MFENKREKRIKSTLNVLSPSPLQCWWAHPLHIPHAPQTQPSHGPFCKKGGGRGHPLVKENTHWVGDNKLLSWVNSLLLVRWVLDDSFLPINHVLFELMGQHACKYWRNKLSQACHITSSQRIPMGSQSSRVPHVRKDSPSIGAHLNDFAILFQASVTCVF